MIFNSVHEKALKQNLRLVKENQELYAKLYMRDREIENLKEQLNIALKHVESDSNNSNNSIKISRTLEVHYA